MDYNLNVCMSVSFDDQDIFDYLDDSLVLPKEPTDIKGLDDEAEEIAMDFINNRLLGQFPIEIDKEAMKDNSTFEDLSLQMKIYIYLKRHEPEVYEKHQPDICEKIKRNLNLC